MSLSETKTELLRKFVNKECEQCHLIEGTVRRDKSIVGKLQPHRLTRGSAGGKYELRNIKMCCDKCHKLYHQGEFK